MLRNFSITNPFNIVICVIKNKPAEDYNLAVWNTVLLEDSELLSTDSWWNYICMHFSSSLSHAV